MLGGKSSPRAELVKAVKAEKTPARRTTIKGKLSRQVRMVDSSMDRFAEQVSSVQ
jgi:hypothetical protein